MFRVPDGWVRSFLIDTSDPFIDLHYVAIRPSPPVSYASSRQRPGVGERVAESYGRRIPEIPGRLVLKQVLADDYSKVSYKMVFYGSSEYRGDENSYEVRKTCQVKRSSEFRVSESLSSEGNQVENVNSGEESGDCSQ